MKKIGMMLLGAMTLLGLTGCFEQAGLINVNKDGSGTIKLRMYMSKQMMDQMGSMGAAFGGEDATVNPMQQFKDQLKEQGEDTGATFVSGKDVKNKAGWQGYEASFKFDDITKLVLGKEKDEQEAGGASGPQMDMGEVQYHFEFTKGDVATLKIIADLGDEDDAADEEEAEMPDMSMMAMMKPMMAGMRVTQMIRVDGEIVETNAKFRPGKTGNLILLMDMQMDKLLEEEGGMKKLQSMKKPMATDMPGLKMEDPTRPTVIKFK